MLKYLKNFAESGMYLQLPATLHPGITVVICPLLSLIQDQITTLNIKYGVPATFLNSQQTASQAMAVIQELRSGSVSAVNYENFIKFSFDQRFKCRFTTSFGKWSDPYHPISS